MKEFVYQITSSQIEGQYKHLHHADALRFLEQARLDLLEVIGFPNVSLIERGQLLVITGIDICYKREVLAGKIRVRCQDFKLEGRILIMKQVLYNQADKLAIEAVVSSCFMAKDSRRGIQPPDDFIAAYLQIAE